MHKRLSLKAVVVAAVALTACTGKSQSADSVAVSVEPSSKSLSSGESVSLQAVVTGTANTSVVWTIDETGSNVGTVTSGGLYTAPGAPGTFHVRATSAASPGVFGESTITVASPPVVPGAPSLLNTDIVAGSLTGGEGNLGAYLSLFGQGFGFAKAGTTAQAALGTPSGAQVWLRNPTGDNAWHEVANYRALIPSRVFAKTGVEQIIVQLGSLGGAAPNGAVLDVKVTVNGVDSNVLNGWFTVQPGRFFFASNGTGTAPAGNDATGVVDDITHPFRYAQNCVGPGVSSCSGGIWSVTTTPHGDPGLKPGDTIVLRGGTWTDHVGADPGSDGKGRFIRFYPPFNGSAPNGQVGHGYFNIVRYPGPIMGHAPEDVHYVDSNVNYTNSNSGFIQGTGTASSPSCCSYVVVSGFRCELTANSSGDAGCVSLQYGSHYWRVVDNDMGPWPNPGNLGTKSGGISGEGHNDLVAFNHIHDIAGPDAYENHGIYISDNPQTLKNAHHMEFAYNWFENMMGGSCFQWHGQYAGGGDGGFRYHTLHHNWFEHCKKSAINMADTMGVGNQIYDNVIIATEQQDGGGAFKLTNFQAGMQVDFVHNTVVGFNVWGGSPCLIKSDDTLASTNGAYVNVAHNVLVFGPGSTFPGTSYFDCLTDSGPGGRSSQNLYFNYASAGPHATPPQDATGIYADPNLIGMPTAATTCLNSGNCVGTTTCPGGGCNYAPQRTSPAVNAASLANPIGVPTDFLGFPRPVPDTSTPGSSKNDLGAYEAQ